MAIQLQNVQYKYGNRTAKSTITYDNTTAKSTIHVWQ